MRDGKNESVLVDDRDFQGKSPLDQRSKWFRFQGSVLSCPSVQLLRHRSIIGTGYLIFVLSS